jgi:hypothetical protein
MRKGGQKMDADAIKATGAVYRLTYKKHPLGQPTYWAKLLDVVDGQEKGFLENAGINMIEDGIKISGFESSSRNKQLWWCVPLTPEQNAELVKALARIRP